MIFFAPDVFYSKSNEWAKNFNDVIRVGIDDYSQTSLGDIVHVELVKAGTRVTAGKPFGHVEATKSVCDINAPVSGVVVRVNEAVIKSPGLINIDPYGEGWLAEIKTENNFALSSSQNLMDVQAYKNFLQ